MHYSLVYTINRWTVHCSVKGTDRYIVPDVRNGKLCSAFAAPDFTYDWLSVISPKQQAKIVASWKALKKLT